jgi:hypothetical protein
MKRSSSDIDLTQPAKKVKWICGYESDIEDCTNDIHIKRTYSDSELYTNSLTKKIKISPELEFDIYKMRCMQNKTFRIRRYLADRNYTVGEIMWFDPVDPDNWPKIESEFYFIMSEVDRYRTEQAQKRLDWHRKTMVAMTHEITNIMTKVDINA